MDDEVREIHQEAFDYIILALGLMGLVGAGIAFFLDGPASLWFLRSIALLAVVLVAFVLRRAGQFLVAAYVLVLELIGLVAGAFLQADIFSGFIPYLFIPIIIIASLIIGPYGTLVLAIFSIVIVVAIVVVTGQLTQIHLITLVPPFCLIMLTTLLATLSGRYATKVDKRLVDSKRLLRERTLELLNALEEIKHLQTQAQNLKEQLIKSKTETGQVRQVAAQRDNRSYLLIEGTIQELKSSVKKLEQMTETMVGVSNPLLPQVWQELDHLTSLVISLEELTEIENDETQLEYQQINVAQLLSELVQTGRGLAREKNLELRYLAADNLPLLKADPARLRQALLHLLSNAVKFTDQGLIEIQTELSERELIIFISDTGIGISAEELEMIFQNFGRGQSVPAQHHTGSGLGLPLSKRIIEKHGGRVWATSVSGVGSTFCIALPLETDLATTQLSLPAVTLPSSTRASREAELVTVVAAAKTEPAPDIAGETVLDLPQSATPKSDLSQAQVNFGPVARFSPVYISRFGLTLLGLLLLITGLVLALALTNGLTPSKAQVTQVTPATTPVSVTSNVAALKTPEPVETAASTSVAVSSPAPSPTTTATAFIVTRLPVQTTSFQETLPSPTPTTQATHTPLASPTPLPTATLTAPSTPAPAATPQPVSQVGAPATTGLSGPPTTVFISDPQGYPALSGLGFQSIPNTQLTAVTNPAANSGLSWLRTASGYQALFSGDVATGNRELYLAPNGENQLINLTQAAGDDLQPAVSPDNRRIAFSSGRNGNLDIYMMDADGGNPTQLTTSRGYDEWPAWSPDGRQIAFVSDRDGNVEIYVMDGDGSNQQRLTDNPADDWPVVWSPGGRTLLFASNRDGNWNLYWLELQSGNLTRLTDDPGDEREPVWSPDTLPGSAQPPSGTGARTIAFAYNNGGNWEIYTVPAPTGAPAVIPRSQWTQVSATSRDERYPAWLP